MSFLIQLNRLTSFILLISSFFLLLNCQESSFNENISSKSLETKLIEISNGTKNLQISIENLLKIVQNKELDEIQAQHLWKVFYFENILNEKQETEEKKGSSHEEIIDEIFFEEKQSIGFYQLMIIMSIGFIIVILLVKNIMLALYLSERYNILFVLSLFISYNLIVVAKLLQDQMEANFLPAIIYNTAFLNIILCFHIFLIRVNLQKALVNVTDLFDADMNRKGKILMIVFGLFLSYLFAFSCVSPLVQIPFYLFLFYSINLLRRIYLEKFPKICEPSLFFSYSLFSLLLFCYLYLRGGQSFHECLFILKEIDFLGIFFGFIGQTKLIDFVDFRFFGYLICLGLINSIFPIYLYIQNKNLWADDFNYQTILLNLKEEITREKIEFDFSRLYYFIYGFVLIFLTLFTLREKFLLGTFICLFCLVNVLNMALKNNTFFGRYISFLGGFFLLTCIHLVGTVEDQFASSIISDMRDGYIIYFLDLFSKIIFHYFSVDIISASSFKTMNEQVENTEEKAEKVEENFSAFNMIKLLGAHFLNYLFVVYFLAISEEESSSILSLLGVIFAFILFLKLCIYSYTTKEENKRIFIAIFLYMAGIRFSMLSGDLNAPLYFGNILSNFSVAASYFTTKISKLQYVNLILLCGLFIQSFAVNSSFGLIIAFANFFLFIPQILPQKHKEKKNGIWIFMAIIALMLWALSGFNLNGFFNIIETIMKMLPCSISHSLFKIFDQGLLPEQDLMKRLLKLIKGVFLNSDF